MRAKLRGIKTNLKKFDEHVITPSEYEDIPEITDEMFARATYEINGVEQPHPRHRGLQKAPKKIPLHLRLPAEVVEYFKSQGAGWQTRIGLALQEWIVAHRH